MPYTVDDVVNFIVADDKVGLKDAIDDILSSKAADALEVEKIVVAQNFFNGDSEEETEE